eukprot:GGOE01043759.1.p1 GENE.GGOE01043759.1~~GGOE01043759.1.p1  ORF type:complete len:469 (-),score=91.34 GGOE01043759.1:101-1507(-)
MVQVMTVPSSNLKLLLQPRCLRHCALSDSLDAGHLALEEQTARQAQEMQEMQARHQQEQRYRLRLQGHLLHRKREQEVEALRSKFESALADVVASARAQQAEAALALADLEAALQDEQMAAILARDLLCTAQSQADHFRHQYSAERRRLRASQEEAEKLWLQLQGMQLDTQRMVEALRRQCLEAIAGQKRAELRCELAASLSSSRPPCASQTPQPHHSTQDRPPSHHSFRAREGKADTTGVANGASAGEESTTSILDLSAWTVHSDDLPLSQAERTTPFLWVDVSHWEAVGSTLPLSGDRSPATFSELEWALPISTEQRLAHEEQLWQELGQKTSVWRSSCKRPLLTPVQWGRPCFLRSRCPLPPRRPRPIPDWTGLAWRPGSTGCPALRGSWSSIARGWPRLWLGSARCGGGGSNIRAAVTAAFGMRRLRCRTKSQSCKRRFGTGRRSSPRWSVASCTPSRRSVRAP